LAIGLQLDNCDIFLSCRLISVLIAAKRIYNFLFHKHNINHRTNLNYYLETRNEPQLKMKLNTNGFTEKYD